jgi:uncharacterized membrane protein
VRREEPRAGRRQRTAGGQDGGAALISAESVSVAPALSQPHFAPWARFLQLGVASLLALAAETVALGGQSGAGALGLEGGALSLARVSLGLVAVLVLPGFALSVLLFPLPRDIDGFERTALAVGLSVAQVPLLVLALDRSPWALSASSLVVSLAGTTCLWCLLATVRVAQLAATGLGGTRVQSTSDAAPGAARPGRRARRPATRLELATLLAGAALAAVTAWALLVIVRQPPLPPMTEFTMLGEDGLAEGYPRQAVPGEPVQVTLGIANLEGEPVEYQAVARLGGEDLARTPRLRLESGQTWNGSLQFALREHGFEQRVELLLLRGETGAPYRRLQLVIDAPGPGETAPQRAVQNPVPRR